MADIVFDCPECGGNLEVAEKGAGRMVPCPHCKQFIKIPLQTASAPVAPPPVLPPSLPAQPVASAAPLAPAAAYTRPAVPETSGLAIASLIMALIGLAIPAVICGHMARSRIRKSAGALTGSGMAMAGLVLGYFGIVMTALILNAVLIPSIGHATQKAKMTSAAQAGQLLRHQIMSEGVSKGSSVWPSSQDSSSTAYFIKLMGSDRDMDYSMFAASGIPPCKSGDSSLFKAENNAWCVVADLGGMGSEETPLMFTRNLRIDSLAQDLSPASLSDEPPFGRSGVVVVYARGAVKILRPDELAEKFNPSGATNRVLRP